MMMMRHECERTVEETVRGGGGRENGNIME
jgi:hypothetical protein